MKKLIVGFLFIMFCSTSYARGGGGHGAGGHGGGHSTGHGFGHSSYHGGSGSYFRSTSPMLSGCSGHHGSSGTAEEE